MPEPSGPSSFGEGPTESARCSRAKLGDPEREEGRAAIPSVLGEIRPAQSGRPHGSGSRTEPAEPDGGAILREKKASAGPPALRRVLDGIGPDGGRGQAPPLARGAG
jgi:hypothetical protein